MAKRRCRTLYKAENSNNSHRPLPINYVYAFVLLISCNHLHQTGRSIAFHVLHDSSPLFFGLQNFHGTKEAEKTAHFLHLLVLLWNFLSSPCRLSSRSLADACCKQTLGFFTWNSKNCSADFFSFFPRLLFLFYVRLAGAAQHWTSALSLPIPKV